MDLPAVARRCVVDIATTVDCSFALQYGQTMKMNIGSVFRSFVVLGSGYSSTPVWVKFVAGRSEGDEAQQRMVVCLVP